MLKNKRIFSVILSASLLCGVLSVAPVFAQEANTGTTRLSGNNRYETALAISKSGWMQANTVIIATGADYPDALSAAPFAKVNDAPILLTEKGALSSDTITEIQRLKATNAILVGGTGVISTNVENQLKNIGVNFTRIGGINRYETSKLVAEKLGTSNGIIVATGLDFPDALSIAPIAGIKSMPILLSPKDGLDPSVAAFIKDKSIPVSYIVGGTGVLGDKVASSVPNSKRLGGKNRYETNQIINNQFVGSLSFGTAFLATGNDFPDALSGSALAAKNNASIILSDKNSMTDETLNFIKSEGVMNVSILGGTGAISNSVQDVITNTINNNIVNPSAVSLNKTTNTLTVGATDTLIATISPSNATNKNVQWSTSNSNVATVDAAGKVTAIAAGTATITVTTVSGNKTASCNITVENPVINVSSVSLNETSSTHTVGNTDTLIASVLPSNATNKNVQWSTSNSNVATVDAAGKVTAIGAGTATITATTVDGNKTASCNITVQNPVINPSVPANMVISYAYNFLGTPYLWGGNSPNGFDASGFVQYIFAHFNITVGRTIYDQVKVGNEISRENLLPGDIVFFGSLTAPVHVGIYLGNNTFINSPHTGDVVKISPMTRTDYATARRVIN
ncbi:cell wall-binding repeat-containing protein [Candidatus Clostridium radicumherbarum]|uniref:Cell wall-binding repeat-containing protein n=1 Tax=Candidatus Clostridium radicumherbarum TaxID=3381662 RepID=A0ABW8TUH4_9CLOT